MKKLVQNFASILTMVGRLTIDCVVSAYLLHLPELDNDCLSLLVFGLAFCITSSFRELS